MLSSGPINWLCSISFKVRNTRRIVAAATFGQVIAQSDEDQQDRIDDAVSQFFLLPIVVLTGLAMSFSKWTRLSVPVALLIAVLVRRLTAVGSAPVAATRARQAGDGIRKLVGSVGLSALF